MNAAKLLGVSGDSGTFELGKRGDLIAVSGDPLADVRVLPKLSADRTLP